MWSSISHWHAPATRRGPTRRLLILCECREDFASTDLPLEQAGRQLARASPRQSGSGEYLSVTDPSLDFYCGVLGFQLTQRYGDSAAFIAAGRYHHHIGLNTWESLGGRLRHRVRRD